MMELTIAILVVLVIIALLLFSIVKGIEALIKQNNETHSTHLEWIEEAYNAMGGKKSKDKIIIGEESTGDATQQLAEEALRSFDVVPKNN